MTRRRVVCCVVAVALLSGCAPAPVSDLAQAAGALEARTTPGRFTGGLPYAPVSVATRGKGAAPAPQLLMSVARVQRAMLDSFDPASRATLGVGWALLGDFEQSVGALELAVLQTPADANLQSDLSSAYLGRATHRGLTEDLPRALRASSIASREAPGHPEALFNRAMALEALGLRRQAVTAWRSFLAVDSTTAWAREASERLKAIESIQPDVTPDSQDRRERVEDQLLAQWGAEYCAGDRAAASARLADAAAAADELVRLGGDRMAQFEVHRIAELTRAGSPARLLHLACGFELFGEARRAYLGDRQLDASQIMQRAAVRLSAADSPYALWAPIYRSIHLRNDGALPGAIAALAPLKTAPSQWTLIHARKDWAHGVALGALGRFDLAREPLARALAVYESLRETDNSAATETLVAEADWILGDHVSAWDHVGRVIKRLARRPRSRRTYHYGIGALLARADGNVDSEIAFASARLDLADRDRSRAEALIDRAKTYTRAGDRPAARADLTAAAPMVERLVDATLRNRLSADITIVGAGLITDSDPARSIQQASDAVAYVSKVAPAIRLAPLLLMRGHGREAIGDLDGARRDFQTVIDGFEAKRGSLMSPADRILGFEQERVAQDALIRHEYVTRSNPWGAFAVAERARSSGGFTKWGRSTPATTLDLGRVRARLPDDVAILYYEQLTDRLLIWALTRDGQVEVVRPIALRELAQAVERTNRLIAAGARLKDVAVDGRWLFDNLVAPVLTLIGSKPRWFIVPDGPLHALPFATLPDANGAPLVESRVTAVATSVRHLLAASDSLATFSPDAVAAFGDGYDRRRALPQLVQADAEAIAVADQYPSRQVFTGSSATSQAFLESTQPVLHFAGHTVVNQQFPFWSELMFAPSGADVSQVRASDIAERQFIHTRLVVLATCEAASGRAVDGEGLVSVATAFLAAGVPAVVAAIWPVDDAESLWFFTQFHRELRLSADPAAALRTTQLSVIHGAGAAQSIRTWAGYLAFGGMHLN